MERQVRGNIFRDRIGMTQSDKDEERVGRRGAKRGWRRGNERKRRKKKHYGEETRRNDDGK